MFKEVEIPEIFEAAIIEAQSQLDCMVSRITVQAVLANLPQEYKDTVAASFYLKAYKSKNKRQSKTSKFVDAVKNAISGLEEDNPVKIAITKAVDEFTAKDADFYEADESCPSETEN